MINANNAPIAPSELIITSKGTIYHLDLAPHQLASTIITVGDPDRVQEVSKHFDRIEHRAQHREFVTHTGYIGSKRISVVSTGIGPDNIDIVLNEMDALVNINFETRTIKEEITSLNIIRLGTCGGLQAGVDTDGLVVSTYAIGMDNLLHYYVHESNDDEAQLLQSFLQHTDLLDKPVRPYIAKGSTTLAGHFTDGYIHGITATCPGFYGPQGRILRAERTYPDLLDRLASFRKDDLSILNFEMETSAIYGLGKLLGHQCLSISTVVANRARKTFSSDGAKAVNHMIELSLGVIEYI